MHPAKPWSVGLQAKHSIKCHVCLKSTVLGVGLSFIVYFTAFHENPHVLGIPFSGIYNNPLSPKWTWKKGNFPTFDHWTLQGRVPPNPRGGPETPPRARTGTPWRKDSNTGEAEGTGWLMGCASSCPQRNGTLQKFCALGRRNVMILGRNRTGTLWYRLRMAKRCSWDVISGHDVSLSSRWICRPTRLSLLVTTWIFWRCALNDLRYCLFQVCSILSRNAWHKRHTVTNIGGNLRF